MFQYETGSWKDVSDTIVRFGWSGVDLYFVLSGILVGGLLFDEIRRRYSVDIRRFLVRRAFEIRPMYFAYIAATPVLLHLRDDDPWGRAFRETLPNLLHLQNYLGTRRGHTWSLAVEEHFYLELPVLLCILLHRTQKCA